MMHDLQGNTSFQPYGKTGQAIYSVSRSQLNTTLIQEAQKYHIRFFFDEECIKADFNTKTLQFKRRQTHILSGV